MIKLPTEVQLRALDGVSQGKTFKEIAVESGCSKVTIKARLTRLYEILGAENRAHAVAIALKEGLIMSHYDLNRVVVRK